MYVGMYICMYVCIYVCLYVWNADGLECRGRLVTALLCANDAVLFADDEEGVRVSLEVLSGWC